MTIPGKRYSERRTKLNRFVDIIDQYWQKTLLLAFRVFLFMTFISFLIPTLRDRILSNHSILLPIVVSSFLIAFEILIACIREDSEIDKGFVLENTQDLVEQLAGPLNQQQVTLDIFAYSSETFHAILGPYFRQIVNKELPLKQIHIRMLVRDYTRPFIIPCVDDGIENEQYRATVVKRSITLIDDFESDINQLLDNTTGIDIKFEIRMHPFEPLFKGIVINGSRGFWNLYSLMNARRRIQGEERIIWDYYGERTRLISLSNDGPIAEREMLKSTITWFSTTWDYFSTPVLQKHIDEV